MLRTNVLVIGGGPAGSTAARLLASHNIETILIERDISYIKPCGGGIPYAAFHELDIPLNTITKEINKIAVVSPKGERIEANLKGGHLCLVKRGDFDNTLRTIAAASGARLLEAEFIRFEKLGKNIISAIRQRNTKEEIKIKSDYVIASDGITSRSASSLGIQKNNSIYTISMHMPSTEHPMSPAIHTPDACEFWFGSDHASNFYSWVFPFHTYLSVGTGATDPKKLSAMLDRFMIRRFNTPLKNIAEKKRAFRLPLWNKGIFNIKNILFAGDSAGMVMPVTYEGIYYAMKAGEFAAQAIIQRRPSVYKRLWDKRFKSRFVLMSKIKNYLFKNNENIEKFVALHKTPEVQEIAMRLWLSKETGASILISYIKILARFLRF